MVSFFPFLDEDIEDTIVRVHLISLLLSNLFISCLFGTGNVVWSTYVTNYFVLRHEVGHNCGHFHHLSNRYERRLSSAEFGYDGWDFMSGIGNSYIRSDLPAASKWWYNWITDDAVVMMQPEGSSDYCPNCLASVTGLVLKPFDNPSVQPSSSNLMAVHIPILGTTGDRTYSYWLSYRSGNDGLAAIGLSAHIAWFTVSGIMGASFDSWNFDAFGNTPSTFDSFILPGTCYILAPPYNIMQVDIGVASLIQPIVCVDSINEEVDITISVSFLNASAPPADKAALVSNSTFGCSTIGTSSGSLELDVSNSGVQMIHYTGTGMNGNITLSMCLESTTSMTAYAYFYDT